MFFYYDKEKAENGVLFCLGQEEKLLSEDEIIESGKQSLYSNYVYHESDYVLIGHPIVEGNRVRIATDRELIELGLYELQDGEILDGDYVFKVPSPGIKYKWDTYKWIVAEELLEAGEICDNNKIVKIDPPDDIYSPVWNFTTLSWEESDDALNIYHEHIDYLKQEILDCGFIYVDKNSNKHRQKTRLVDKINLEMVISSLQKCGSTEIWYFDVDDSPELTLDELEKMKDDGIIFNRSVFAVENMLKKTNPNKMIDLEYFKNEIDKVSSVKCYRG